jgi:hypothetical protein
MYQIMGFNRIFREENCFHNPRRIIRVIQLIMIQLVYLFMDVHWKFVSFRMNCRTNEEVLCQLKDAALKFRGCFQAVCEPRSVPVGGGWLVRRVVVSMVCGRQGVVVLEPTYRASKWPSVPSLPLTFLPSLFLPLHFPPSLFISSTFQICRSLSLSCSSHRFHIFTFSPILFTSHPSFALYIDHGNEWLFHDVFWIDSLKQARIWSTICINYFITSIPRRKWSKQIGISVWN